MPTANNIFAVDMGDRGVEVVGSLMASNQVFFNPYARLKTRKKAINSILRIRQE